jgi:hypothetical protein
MAYEDEDGDHHFVVRMMPGWTWPIIDEPRSIVRIYWPGLTPVVIWERA